MKGNLGFPDFNKIHKNGLGNTINRSLHGINKSPFQTNLKNSIFERKNTDIFDSNVWLMIE